MQVLTCKEKAGWNISLAELTGSSLEEVTREILTEYGLNARFPFTYLGRAYTVFYDDEIFTRGKKTIVATLYLQGDAQKTYLDPEGPDLVFGDFVIAGGHAHDGTLTGLEEDDVKKLSTFILESEAKLKEMRQAKLFRDNETIRSALVQRRFAK